MLFARLCVCEWVRMYVHAISISLTVCTLLCVHMDNTNGTAKAAETKNSENVLVRERDAA